MFHERSAQYVEHVVALLMHGVEVGADDAKVLCSLECSESTGDFLFDLGHADSALAQVVGERHRQVCHFTQHRVGTTKDDMQKFQKNPQGKHVTTQAKGRLPGPEAAKEKYGLEKKPNYVFTGKAKDLKV